MSFSLKSLMVDTKSAWVEYPGFDGFKVEVVNLGRERLVNLRKSATKQEFNKKTRAYEEVLDDKKFIEKFSNETVKNWEGLKLSYLEQMMLVDIADQDADTELDFSPENAVLLVTNSGDFDNWLNTVVFDLENFRSEPNRGSVDQTGEVAA